MIPGCRIQHREHFTVVTQEQLPNTVADARSLQMHLTTFFILHNVRRVIWDMREAAPNAEEGRAEMWRWLQESSQIRVSAFVVQSPMLRVSANMRALSGGMCVRSFGDMKQAESWIAGQSA